MSLFPTESFVHVLQYFVVLIWCLKTSKPVFLDQGIIWKFREKSGNFALDGWQKPWFVQIISLKQLQSMQQLLYISFVVVDYFFLDLKMTSVVKSGKMLLGYQQTLLGYHQKTCFLPLVSGSKRTFYSWLIEVFNRWLLTLSFTIYLIVNCIVNILLNVFTC